MAESIDRPEPLTAKEALDEVATKAIGVVAHLAEENAALANRLNRHPELAGIPELEDIMDLLNRRADAVLRVIVEASVEIETVPEGDLRNQQAATR